MKLTSKNTKHRFAVMLILVGSREGIDEENDVDKSLLLLQTTVESLIELITEAGGMVVSISGETILGAWPDGPRGEDRSVCAAIQKLRDWPANVGSGTNRFVEVLPIDVHVCKGDCIVLWDGERIKTLLGGPVLRAYQMTVNTPKRGTRIVVDATIKGLCEPLACEDTAPGCFLVL